MQPTILTANNILFVKWYLYEELSIYAIIQQLKPTIAFMAEAHSETVVW